MPDLCVAIKPDFAPRRASRGRVVAHRGRRPIHESSVLRIRSKLGDAITVSNHSRRSICGGRLARVGVGHGKYDRCGVALADQPWLPLNQNPFLHSNCGGSIWLRNLPGHPGRTPESIGQRARSRSNQWCA